MTYEYKTLKFTKHVSELEYVLSVEGEKGFKLISILELKSPKDYYVYDSGKALMLILCKEISMEK